LRSVHHQEAPIHETGQQLLQTGSLVRGGTEWPHCGAVLSRLRPAAAEVPPWVVLPRTIGNTGVNVGHGQTAGFLGPGYEPFIPPAGTLAADVEAGDPTAPHGLDPARLSSRKALVEAVDAVQRDLDCCDALRGADTVTAQVLGQVFSPQTKRAFD